MQSGILIQVQGNYIPYVYADSDPSQINRMNYCFQIAFLPLLYSFVAGSPKTEEIPLAIRNRYAKCRNELDLTPSAGGPERSSS